MGLDNVDGNVGPVKIWLWMKHGGESPSYFKRVSGHQASRVFIFSHPQLGRRRINLLDSVLLKMDAIADGMHVRASAKRAKKIKNYDNFFYWGVEARKFDGINREEFWRERLQEAYILRALGEEETGALDSYERLIEIAGEEGYDIKEEKERLRRLRLGAKQIPQLLEDIRKNNRRLEIRRQGDFIFPSLLALVGEIIPIKGGRLEVMSHKENRGGFERNYVHLPSQSRIRITEGLVEWTGTDGLRVKETYVKKDGMYVLT